MKRANEVARQLVDAGHEVCAVTRDGADDAPMIHLGNEQGEWVISVEKGQLSYCNFIDAPHEWKKFANVPQLRRHIENEEVTEKSEKAAYSQLLKGDDK